MNQELIQEAKSMLNTSEKWNAFLDLTYQKDNIRNQWFTKLKDELGNTFLNNYFSSHWDFKINGGFSIQWFLKEFGENSISLWLENENFSLYAPNNCNIEEIYKLIKSEKFLPLVNCFERSNSISNGGYIITDKGNFSFGTPYDTNFELDRLAWFAGNETENFINQITVKVNKFRLNEEVTNLLKELNQLTKNQL